MSGLRVPRSQAENPAAGNNDLFPEGTFVFEIVTPTTEDMRVRVQSFDELPEWMTTEPEWGGPSFATGDLTQLNVWLQNRGIVEGETDPGEQIFFQQFTIQDGQMAINQVDLDEQNGEGTAIRRDARLWAGLNLALGAVEIEVEDGEEYVVPAPNAAEIHLAGGFDTRTVIGEVVHKQNKAKTKTYARIARFEEVATG